MVYRGRKEWAPTGGPGEGPYKFEQLPAEGRERAIEAYREKGWCWDEHNTQQLTDWFKEELERKGYMNPDVNWNLSYSQGDGVVFDGEIDFGVWRKKASKAVLNTKLVRRGWDGEECASVREPSESRKGWSPTAGSVTVRELLNNRNLDVSFTITMRSAGPGLSGMSVSHEIVYVEKESESAEIYEMKVEYWEAFGLDLEEALYEEAQDVAGDLEKVGYKDIEYQCSDEVIQETIVANEWEFDWEGNME